jgi:acyl-CoA reductase-like NAD-dependent aldehyde dehydrogenase
MIEYKEKIVNLETGETVWRDYTPNEIAEVKEAQTAAVEAAAAEAKATAEAEAARQALLDKLGITADEAKLLLG